jgi:hypothetical protein
VGEVRVQPNVLESAGSSLAGTGEQVGSISEVIVSAGAVAPSTGDGSAAEAYTRMCGVWATEVEQVGSSVSSLGRLVALAGAIYRKVDEAVMPPGD